MAIQRVAREHHTWVDLRKALRRVRADRREMFRYGPDKADRRQGFGRRKEDQLWDSVRSRS